MIFKYFHTQIWRITINVKKMQIRRKFENNNYKSIPSEMSNSFLFKTITVKSDSMWDFMDEKKNYDIL